MSHARGPGPRAEAAAAQDPAAVVEELVREIGTSRAALVPLLQAVQARYGYLPPPVLDALVSRTGLHPGDVHGVATCYPQFRPVPAGRTTIRVCVGTACHVKGADRVYDAFHRVLGLEGEAETDARGEFTLSRVACLGCCMLAPVVQIGAVTYGEVDPAGVGELLKEYRQTLASAPAPRRAEGRKPRGEGPPAAELRLCTCSSCSAAGASKVRRALEHTIRRQALSARFVEVACTGASSEAPLLELVCPGAQSVLFPRLRPEEVETVVAPRLRSTSVLRSARAAGERLLRGMATGSVREGARRVVLQGTRGLEALAWGRQVHLVTEGSGRLDPLDLEGYRRAGGLTALSRLQTPDGAPWVGAAGASSASATATAAAPLRAAAVVDEIEASGLRGRGGAGFPAGRKWRAVSGRAGERRFVICNGDEGDPGAFMDRLLLESFPFRVIEGLCIACFAVGAGCGILYVREEYPEARARMASALASWRQAGLLPSGLDLRLFSGPGAFVCGEETALIASLEGRRGTPRFRPPYPEAAGLEGMPTLVNNVETLAAVPWILAHGAGAFRAVGTDTSPGTKTFALAGKVRRGGLVEVPMGMSLREIVEDVGGGVGPGGAWKAVQIGGPSGGCVPAALGHLPVEYETLVEAGAFMGSGGLVVLDQTDCMVDIARYFMAFSRRESCGKCAPCRIGTARLSELLERLCAGTAAAADLAELEDLALRVAEASLCNLGKSAPNPVLSTLRFFREEYAAHLEGRCPALRCVKLIRYEIGERCIGCTRCAQSCPVGAIPFTPHRRHLIDEARCVRCGRCAQVCPVHAPEVRDR